RAGDSSIARTQGCSSGNAARDGRDCSRASTHAGASARCSDCRCPCGVTVVGNRKGRLKTGPFYWGKLNGKAPSDLSSRQIPPCGGCPSRTFVFLNCLDASSFELAFVGLKLLRVATTLSGSV